MTPTTKLLLDAFPNFPWKFQHSLAQQSYFKIGGVAEAYLECGQLTDLTALTALCHQQGIPLRVLGGASNVIIADEGVSGVVLRLTHDRVTSIDSTTIRVGAGAKTALAVSQSVALGLTGLEYFLGIPGTIGGVVYNNGHYATHLIGDYVSAVQVVTPKGEDVWINQAACEFGYDRSRFHQTKEIIFEVEFQLKPGTTEQSQALIAEATRYRATTQPLGEPSSGCIFQNVPNTPELQALFPQFKDKPFISGGFIIDQAGLKGTRVGDIEVSQKHAAFFVNKGKGTAQDLKQLIQIVKNRVQSRFSIDLREEVFYVS